MNSRAQVIRSGFHRRKKLMENMIIIAEDIIKQPMVSVLTNFREIFLGRGGGNHHV